MEYNKSHLAFLPIAVLLLVYGFFFTDELHHFVLNAGWENNVISTRLIVYLIVGLGLFFTGFYALLRPLFFSRNLVRLHVFLYLLLVIVIVLWERNVFSLQEAIHNDGNPTLSRLRVDYKEIADLNDYYRSLFWFFLVGQTVCFFNLLLGFFRNLKQNNL